MVLSYTTHFLKSGGGGGWGVGGGGSVIRNTFLEYIIKREVNIFYATKCFLYISRYKKAKHDTLYTYFAFL